LPNLEGCHAGKDNRHQAFIEVKASEYGLGASRIRASGAWSPSLTAASRTTGWPMPWPLPIVAAP
jgi:hypothetical protein